MKQKFRKRILDIDDSQFVTNLHVTQAYCEKQLEREELFEWVALRSVIGPICKDEKWYINMSFLPQNNFYNQTILWEEWSKIVDPYDVECFDEIFNSQIEFKESVANRLERKGAYQGKILVVEYSFNIPDGAVEDVTEGFFDEIDLPPIDTWFFKASDKNHGGILFAWVPEQFVELVDKAINIHLLNIIHWFEDWAPLDYRAIMQTE